MPVKRKLDIFKVLDSTSRKDTAFFKRLTEEEQKGYVPSVTMRWLSGTTDKRQIYFINEILNPYAFSLYKHPELLYYLSTLCTTGQTRRYHWNKTISKKSTGAPNVVSVIRKYFGYSTSEAVDALLLLSKEDILQYTEELGIQPEVITKIKREIRGLKK